MPPDEPTDEERQEQLPQDGSTPFTPADPAADNSGAPDPAASASDDAVPVVDPAAQTPAAPLDDTHPATDSGLDSQQVYDEGVAGAAETGEPNPGTGDSSDGATPATPATPPSDDPEDAGEGGEHPAM